MTTTVTAVDATPLEPAESNSWFAKLISKIMKVIAKLLVKFGIKIGM
ncbi:MAG: hypothetical protein NC177_17030 [Ruminococcus flavefaciens]|nr:hypothetical protein [Ruminococcus flavefaciens]